MMQQLMMLCHIFQEVHYNRERVCSRTTHTDTQKNCVCVQISFCWHTQRDTCKVHVFLKQKQKCRKLVYQCVGTSPVCRQFIAFFTMFAYFYRKYTIKRINAFKPTRKSHEKQRKIVILFTRFESSWNPHFSQQQQQRHQQWKIKSSENAIFQTKIAQKTTAFKPFHAENNNNTTTTNNNMQSCAFYSIRRHFEMKFRTVQTYTQPNANRKTKEEELVQDTERNIIQRIAIYIFIYNVDRYCKQQFCVLFCICRTKFNGNAELHTHTHSHMR